MGTEYYKEPEYKVDWGGNTDRYPVGKFTAVHEWLMETHLYGGFQMVGTNLFFTDSRDATIFALRFQTR